MKKLSFKSCVSLLLAFVLTFSVVLPAMGADLCTNGKAHDWSATTVVPASCAEKEYQTKSCNRCHQVYKAYNNNTTALGHQEEIRSNGDGTHTTYCMRNECDYKKVENCSTANPVCGVIPTCDACKTKYGTEAAHAYGAEVVTKAATCTEKGTATQTCTNCNNVKNIVLEALKHDYKVVTVIKNVTCTEDGKETVKCSRCNHTEDRVLEKTGHEYKKTTVAPTCKEQGYDLFECKNCDESHKSNFNAVLAHDYEETRTEPTCDQDGLITYKCKTCKLPKDSTVIPKLGHDMSGFVVTTEPTCTVGGLKTDKCSRCSRTITETIPAKGHEYEKTVVAPTCTEIGYTLNKCKGCSLSTKDNYTEATGHKKVLTGSIQASCTYSGYNVYTCESCLLEIREEIKPLGHSFDYKSNNDATCTSDGTKSGKCTRCPQTSTVADEGSKLGHSFTQYVSNNNATCTKNATQWSACDRGCGAKDVKDVPGSALGHKNETIKGKAATCTDTGLTDGAKCTVCGDITTAQTVIPAKGHNYTSTIVTAPTCVKVGSANFKCEDCGHTYVGEVAATGNHKWDNGTATLGATCEEDGTMLYKCQDCTNTKTEKINRLGHSYSTEYTVDTPATCYREGEKSKHCTRTGCQAKSETMKISMIDHVLGDYESNGDATCEKDGTKSQKCKVCTYKTSPIADPGTKLGHKYTNYVSDGNTTCLKDGTKTALCDNGCGLKDTVVEKSTGHDARVDKAVAPTCTESGLTEGKTCSKCGHIIVAQQIIDATGHNEAKKEEKAPTCTKTGLSAGVYCINCKEDIIPQETIAKLGHDYSKKVTKATTSKNGKIDSTCNRCGYEKTTTLYAVTSIKLASSTYYYNGETQAPEKAVVTDSKDQVLKAGTDYDIDYSVGTISAKIGTYKVKIVLKGNYSGSKTLSFKIVPGKISKIKTDKTTTSIKLNWSKSEGATGYRVYRYDTATKKWVTVKSSTTALSYTVKGLKAGTLYTFSVKPYYKKGDTVIWGESKRWETATLPATPTVKATPGAKSATLSWNKVSGATGYVIYYSTSANGTYTKLGSTKSNVYTAKNLTALKGAFFKVRAYKTTANGNVYGDYSKYAKAVPTLV